MIGMKWLKLFFKTLEKDKYKSYLKNVGDTKWTNFLKQIMTEIRESKYFNCHLIHNKARGESHGKYSK